jgi:hypothetical protein
MPGIEGGRRTLPVLALALLLVATASAQESVPRRRTSVPTFRFSPEAGRALRGLWEASVATNQERVACLGAEVRNDSVFVLRLLPLQSAADSMTAASDESVERCGPPEWSGTVHSHVAEYSGGLPSTTFSAQDRGVMRRWYRRWGANGVFCVVYSRRDAHCEADGVIGGIRSRPTVTR